MIVSLMTHAPIAARRADLINFLDQNKIADATCCSPATSRASPT